MMLRCYCLPGVLFILCSVCWTAPEQISRPAAEYKILSDRSTVGVPTLLLRIGSRQQEVANSEKKLKCQRERTRAVSMVEQTAAEAALWDDKKAAVQVLTDAADLDSELTEKFLKQLSENEPAEKKERGAFDDRTARSEQLLQMARQAVNSNPDLAFSLAERSLADGISYGLQTVLTSLRKKNVELANRLFDSTMQRFSSRVPEPSEAEGPRGHKNHVEQVRHLQRVPTLLTLIGTTGDPSVVCS